MLRKVMLLGLGAAAMTKEALEKTVDDLVKKGELSEEEAKETIRDLWAKSQIERENLTKTVREQVDKTMQKLAGVTRGEFAAVLARIEALEAKLEATNVQLEVDPVKGIDPEEKE